jgi:hypothetical protein
MKYEIADQRKTGAFLPSAASNVKPVKKNKSIIDLNLIQKLEDNKITSNFVPSKKNIDILEEKPSLNIYFGAIVPSFVENPHFVEKNETKPNLETIKKLEEAFDIKPEEIQMFLNIHRISDLKCDVGMVYSKEQEVKASEAEVTEFVNKLSESEHIEEIILDYSDSKTFQFPKTRVPRLDLVAALGWEEIIPDDEPPLDVANVCGFHSSWVYKCTPWRYHIICVENITEGAWVPYPVMQRFDYTECKIITQSSGRQFSKDHSTDYK